MKKEDARNFKVGTLIAEYDGKRVEARYKFFKSTNKERFIVSTLKDIACAMFHGDVYNEPCYYDEDIRKKLIVIDFSQRPLTQEEYDAWYETQEWKNI